jgi:NitT/TauT family transport system ATP-binding protein
MQRQRRKIFKVSPHRRHGGTIATMKEPILEVVNVSYSYKTERGPIPVLKDISFSVHYHEFVSIVAPTGTGKTTLLRIIAGLRKPDSGKVLLMGEEVRGPTPKLAMIFQDFALFPWLTALENVELALMHRRDLNKEVKRKIARKYLALVGLEGFEDYYPRELSGGMKQRVAIARALAAQPVVLLMDEPFANLDAITAEGLRSEVYNMVFNEESTVKAIVMVSHNLEEVVELSDKVIILGGKPAGIIAEVDVELPRPRNTRDAEFQDYLDRLYSLLSISLRT